MTTGMIFAGVAFLICANFQTHIDNTCVTQKITRDGLVTELCVSEHFSIAWFLIPYFIVTVAEVLFSISGLNFTYTEVGSRMKSSCAALWLLTVAFGNLLTTALFAATESWDRSTFFYMVAALCFCAAAVQFILNRFYTYKSDRKSKTIS
jgi:dipeptide/tripeptide permease